MTVISILAALGRDRELGRKGTPFSKIADKMRYFEPITKGKPVIMGRKTFEMIGPLPGRHTIVVSRDPGFAAQGATVATSLASAISLSERDKVFVIGGCELYKEALPLAARLYLTLIDSKDWDADIYFPPYEQEFSRTMLESPGEDNGVRYRFVILEREKASE